MKVYVFGNNSISYDNLAFKAAKKLTGKIPNLQFLFIKPNEDLPFADEEKVVIMDTIQGINQVKIISEKDLYHLILAPRSTVHDFDLGFQLKYLKKLGKLGKITIVGLPQNGKIDYSLIQLIFKKLVAQDMHGS